jgi:hypothetical protein
MDDSLQSDTIQFEPTSRLSIGSNDIVNNNKNQWKFIYLYYLSG